MRSWITLSLNRLKSALAGYLGRAFTPTSFRRALWSRSKSLYRRRHCSTFSPASPPLASPAPLPSPGPAPAAPAPYSARSVVTVTR